MVSLISSTRFHRIIAWTHFIPHGSEEVTDRVSPILPMSSETASDRLVESRVPVFTDNLRCASLECDQGRIGGVRIGDEIESIRCVTEESEAFLRLPEIRMC